MLWFLLVVLWIAGAVTTGAAMMVVDERGWGHEDDESLLVVASLFWPAWVPFWLFGAAVLVGIKKLQEAIERKIEAADERRRAVGESQR